jgi:hypothetical protein
MRLGWGVCGSGLGVMGSGVVCGAGAGSGGAGGGGGAGAAAHPSAALVAPVRRGGP